MGCSRLFENTTFLAITFTVLAVSCKLVSLVSKPIWIDSLAPVSFMYNVSHKEVNQSSIPSILNVNSTSATHQASAYFNIFIQSFIPFVFWSVVLGVKMVFFPKSIPTTDRRFPKRILMIPGTGQGICAMFINYSVSGARTAPYLQAVLTNCFIPIQFIVRWEIKI